MVFQKNITNILYKNYYQGDETPQELVSSHWHNFHKKVKVKMIDGKVQSLQGYGFGDLQYGSFHVRVFNWLTVLSYLVLFNDRKAIIQGIKVALTITKKMELVFSYDCFRQVCALVSIKKHLSDKKVVRIINIGDGYGFLSALIKEMIPQAQVYLVDLGKTLFFQSYYIQKAHSDKTHGLISNEEMGSTKNFDQLDFIYCPAENLSALDENFFDVAINIASLQEMNTETIKGYFNFLRNHMEQDHLFYCCNREEKSMPGGEISRFMDYPWKSSDQYLVDELCPWYKYYLALRPTKRGIKILGCRIPFINYFDGELRHRLVILSSD